LGKTVNIFELIRKNEIANRFVKVFSVDVFVKGATFLLLPVYLHLMTKEEVGTFNYMFAFIQTLSIVLNFGLYPAQSKLYHEYKGMKRRQLLFSINLLLVSFLVLFLLPIYAFGLDIRLINFIFEYPIPYHLYRWPLLLALITSVGSYILFNYLLTSEKIRQVQIYNLLRLFISNGFVIGILYFSEGDKVLSRLITYYSCELFLWLCFFIGYAKRFAVKIDFSQIKRILSICIPVSLLSLISTTMGFSDKFFVLQKTNMSVMAIYTTGITIASVCSLIIMSFQNIWLPVFLKEKNVEINFRRTIKMSKIIVGSFTGIAIIMIIGVKIALMLNIIPSSYNDVLKILPFLFVAQIIHSVNVLFGNYFLYFERMRLSVLVGSCIYAVSFFINFILIPRYGVNGAIMALLLNSTILLTTVYLIARNMCRNHKILNPTSLSNTVVVPE